jgi:Arc/MetJ-type ribon-helix-helix transcriptional regulator
MRKARTISLTEELSKYVDQQVKTRGYASSSEYLRDLIRKEKELEIINDVKKSEEDFKAGRFVRAKSMRDLIK